MPMISRARRASESIVVAPAQEDDLRSVDGQQQSPPEAAEAAAEAAPRAASKGTLIINSLWHDLIGYLDIISDDPDPWRMTGRLLLVACRSGRHRPLVPRPESLVINPGESLLAQEPSLDGLNRMLPFCFHVVPDPEGNPLITYDQAAFEASSGVDEMLPGLLGPLMLQFLLISNGAGMIYLPAVLVIVTIVLVKDWDSECAVSEFPVSLLLGIKGSLHLVMLLLRLIIHKSTIHWKAALQQIKKDIRTRRDAEKRAYLEINRLLPDRYQTVDQHELFEDDDTSLEHIEEESDSSARRRRAKQPKLKEDEKGFWIQELVAMRHKVDELFLSSLEATNFHDEIASQWYSVVLMLLLPINLAWDIVAIVFLINLRNFPCPDDRVYFTLWILSFIAILTVVQRLLAVLYWLVQLVCSPSAARKWMQRRLDMLDQRDYAGLPITKFAFNAYFDVSRPARTRKALLTLRRLIKEERQEESVKRALRVQTLLDQTLYHVDPEELKQYRASRDVVEEAPQDPSSLQDRWRFHLTRLFHHEGHPKHRRSSFAHLAPSVSLATDRQLRLDQLVAVSDDLYLLFSQEFENRKEEINNLLDVKKVKKAVRHMPRFLSVCRDLLEQLEMQRSITTGRMRDGSQHFTAAELALLEAQDDQLRRRELEVEEVMEECTRMAHRHRHYLQRSSITHMRGMNSSAPLKEEEEAQSERLREGESDRLSSHDGAGSATLQVPLDGHSADDVDLLSLASLAAVRVDGGFGTPLQVHTDRVGPHQPAAPAAGDAPSGGGARGSRVARV